MPQRPGIHRPHFAAAVARANQRQEQQRKQLLDLRRPGSRQRGYDAAWERARRAFLFDHPFCSDPGCGAPATDVDHKLSVATHPHLRLEPSNFRAFCHPHHSQRTARDQGFARWKSKGRGEVR